MMPGLIQVDGFLPDPFKIREKALDQEFKSHDYAGHTYSGIGAELHFQPRALVSRAVGFDIEPVMSFFRLGLEGDETTTFIHADTAVEDASWAGVLHLTAPEHMRYHGTAFWTHRELGWRGLPSAEQIEGEGYRPDDEFFARIDQDGQSEDAWYLDGFSQGAFNRFLAYPTSRFHSRYPKDTWGQTPEEGRLIWVVFFKPAD